MKRIIVPILLVSSITSCLKDEPFKSEYTGFTPKNIHDDWIIETPENENVNRSLLNQAYQLVYNDNRYWMARSLLVIRNGHLIAEAYPNDENDINKFYNLQSCTKSMTSIVVGIAVRDAKISDLNEKLFNIYPEIFDSDIVKRNITIRDALTMRTGLEFDNDIHTQIMYEEKNNSTAYVLSQTRNQVPGTIMSYNDGAPQLVSKAVELKTGKSMRDYANEKLFKPLNITKWKWEVAHDGTTFGAFSLFLQPRDFGKIGQLILQEGKWENQEIIDSQYLSDATRMQVRSIYNDPYGYYFWILPQFEGFAALGHGGQFLLIVPAKKLVVVYTAWPYTSSLFFDRSGELMRLIYNSCK